MPAVRLKHNTIQSSQNWGVLIAFAAETPAVVTNDGSAAPRVPARGLPALRRDADEQPAHRHEHGVDDAVEEEGEGDPVRIGVGAEHRGRQAEHHDPEGEGQRGRHAPMCSPFSNAGVNALHAYTCPIARWIDSAAGGTSHRLHPGPATIRSRVRKPVTSTPRGAIRIPGV
jgi:hypothetical protein